ncbi:MAG: TPM domain-containing protein [Fibrobacter sp.]|nr:TPM domain-containing protein [Fibrobacter sp.]
MTTRIKTTLALALVLCGIAQALPSRPEKSHVYDENRLVPLQQLEFFDRLSEEVAGETGIGIDAVLLDDIGERNAAQYASEIAEKWQADAGLDGEVLIFVAQKQRRKIVVTKGTASEIISEAEIRKAEQELLVPNFRRERYGDGLLSIAARITFTISDKKGKPIEIDENAIPAEEGMPVRGWIFIVVIFGLLIAFGGKARRFGFFDNMKKLLCVSEIEKSEWPRIFQNVFGENLISAFISGKSLIEGFDALETPWTINFILKDNSPEVVAKLQAYEKRARRDNLQFGHFYTPAEIAQIRDPQELEYLQIASRNAPLCGINPLEI